MTKPAPTDRLLYIMLRAQLLAKQESGDRGYVMLFVSILTVMIFSLLGAYLMMTNLSRASTNAYVEGNSTFYAAESGLNQRADALRQRFLNYDTPSGTSPGVVAGELAGPANMAACLKDPTAGSGDYACKKLELNYRQGLNTTVSTGADGKSLSATDHLDNIRYTAYTFASDRTIYTDPVNKIPQLTVVPAGEPFSGLNIQEYRYTIYSMATSKQPQDLDARAMTVLEMSYKSRAVALFQFAAFYEGDLEMNSTSQMDITGRIHSNGNFYLQSTSSTTATTRLLGPTTIAGKIYNRVDASDNNTAGQTFVLLSGDPRKPDDPSNKWWEFPKFDTSIETPLTATKLAEYKGKLIDGATGASKLKLPAAGFLRKRDKAGNIGEYYGKADLRLEMVPKRTAGNVPFNFTAIKEGGTGCATGFDLSANRQNKTTLKCNTLNEGQLRSLQQPVMVKALSNVETGKFCPASVTKYYNPATPGSKEKLRSLQVAIASQNTPVTLAQLDLPLGHSTNANINKIAQGLQTLSTIDSISKIAANEGACFRPAPIQVLKSGDTTNANYNWQSSYYDRREGRWIGMLQTNIASLTLWNRDGLYVDRDNNFNTNDAPTAGSSQVTAAFNSGNASPTYDTDGLLFNRLAAVATAPAGSFRQLGLGASDNTEGGLTLHATLSDDLGNGKTIPIDTDNLRIYPDGKGKGLYGVAISDGADLPGPFTVATDLPLYAQGDYNNFGGFSARQPASLVGDVITNLSNSCFDNTTKLINCGIETGQNTATETTVNAAFLSHTDLSVGNAGTSSFKSGTRDYSGGLNNYMRMVENWGGVKFIYRGSFVSAGTPQEFSGNYKGGGSSGSSAYYYIPIRDFGYDTNFDAFNLLPPLTPLVVYLQQETFKRSYK
jgi:hypothetical protein